MNVTIDDVDIRTLQLPSSVNLVTVVITVALMVYIVVSCVRLVRDMRPHERKRAQSPLLKGETDL